MITKEMFVTTVNQYVNNGANVYLQGHYKGWDNIIVSKDDPCDVSQAIKKWHGNVTAYIMVVGIPTTIAETDLGGEDWFDTEDEEYDE